MRERCTMRNKEWLWLSDRKWHYTWNCQLASLRGSPSSFLCPEVAEGLQTPGQALWETMIVTVLQAVVAMSDVQNFFQEALAVIFAKA